MGRAMFKMCNFSFSLFPWFLLALVSFHLSLFLSLSLLPEQRVLQRDQAGLAYWKQMADQRQEGHGFMKRASNMPGSCWGAWPWMAAARCEQGRACVNVSILCIVHSFLSQHFDPDGFESPLLLVFCFSTKSQIKGRCLGSIKSGQSGGMFKNNVQLCNC